MTRFFAFSATMGRGRRNAAQKQQTNVRMPIYGKAILYVFLREILFYYLRMWYNLWPQTTTFYCCWRLQHLWRYRRPCFCQETAITTMHLKSWNEYILCESYIGPDIMPLPKKQFINPVCMNKGRLSLGSGIYLRKV